MQRRYQPCPFAEHQMIRPSACDYCHGYLRLGRCSCEFPHSTMGEAHECMYCPSQGETFWSFFEHTGRVYLVRYLCGNCHGMWSPGATRVIEEEHAFVREHYDCDAAQTVVPP